MEKINIALFASGSGSNVENIYNYFQSHPLINVRAVFCNNPNAFVIERCKRLGIECVIFDRNDFYHTPKVITHLLDRNIQWVVLAGFLWLMPETLVAEFPNKIINIHPALLPKYGGKGMYGMRVHEAVHAANEAETGITIHFVNSKYDEGEIIFQAKVKLNPTDTSAAIAKKVHELEYLHYPQQIENLILKK